VGNQQRQQRPGRHIAKGRIRTGGDREPVAQRRGEPRLEQMSW
jgi:hypothetical protein